MLIIDTMHSPMYQTTLVLTHNTVLANKKTNERYAHTIIPFLPNKGTKVTLKFHIHDQFLPSDAY